MLLTIDVGNTNTVLGVFRGEELIANWRLTTARQQTVDEYGVLTRNLFTLAGLDRDAIGGVIISSVVPPVNWTLGEMARIYFGQRALFVEAGVKTGMSVLVDNPLEVGADRIVNGVAAFHKYGGPCIVIKDPGKVIGTNTITHIQAGLYFGAVDMVDGMLARIKAELGKDAAVVATGGQAKLVARGSKHIQHTDEFLTLAGLRIIWSKNQGAETGKIGGGIREPRSIADIKKAKN